MFEFFRPYLGDSPRDQGLSPPSKSLDRSAEAPPTPAGFRRRAPGRRRRTREMTGTARPSRDRRHRLGMRIPGAHLHETPGTRPVSHRGRQSRTVQGQPGGTLHWPPRVAALVIAALEVGPAGSLASSGRAGGPSPAGWFREGPHRREDLHGPAASLSGPETRLDRAGSRRLPYRALPSFTGSGAARPRLRLRRSRTV